MAGCVTHLVVRLDSQAQAGQWEEARSLGVEEAHLQGERHRARVGVRLGHSCVVAPRMAKKSCLLAVRPQCGTDATT